MIEIFGTRSTCSKYRFLFFVGKTSLSVWPIWIYIWTSNITYEYKFNIKMLKLQNKILFKCEISIIEGNAWSNMEARAKLIMMKTASSPLHCHPYATFLTLNPKKQNSNINFLPILPLNWLTLATFILPISNISKKWVKITSLRDYTYSSPGWVLGNE